MEDINLEAEDTVEAAVAAAEAIFDGYGTDAPGDDNPLLEGMELPEQWVRPSRHQLRRFLSLAMAFPSRSSVFVNFKAQDGGWVMQVSNRDEVLEAPVQVLEHSGTVPSRSFSTSVELLARLVSTYESFVLVFDPAATFFQSRDAKVWIDQIRLNLDVSWTPIAPPEMVPFPVDAKELRLMHSLFSYQIRIADSKAVISSSGTEIFLTLFKYNNNIELAVEEPLMVSRLDLPVLYALSKEASPLSWSRDTERVYFQASGLLFSFLRVPYNADQFRYPDSFCTGDSTGSFELDLTALNTALGFLLAANNHEGVFTIDGGYLKLSSNDKAYKFVIGTGSGCNFILPLETLSRVAKSIEPGQSPRMDVHADGLNITYGGRVFSLSKTSMSEVNRELMMEARIEKNLANQKA